MPTTKPAKETQLHLTISLAEVVRLQTENADLKKKLLDVEAECESLKTRIHEITDPIRNADAAAFKRSRGQK